jgi:hypothetical protein
MVSSDGTRARLKVCITALAFFLMCYDRRMKKAKKKVRKNVGISLAHWEQLRRVAFRSHQPMSVVMEHLITNHL